MKQSVMLPEILGRTRFHKWGQDERELNIEWFDPNGWVLTVSLFREGEKEPYMKDVLVLYTTELDELTRWWSELKKAVK